MEQDRLIPMDMPATYRICVTGSLESDLAEQLWGMTSSPVEKIGEREQTVMVGKVADQAALVGVIIALYNSGHALVSVELLKPDAGPRMDDTREET